jgi:dUTP pyrophosphatase
MTPTIVKFAKVHPKAIIPSKREEDAGFDVYACFDEDTIEILPHQTVLVPTGIASAFSSDYYFELKERGSTGVKGIGLRAGVIDSGFRNAWFVAITNHNNKTLLITKIESLGNLKDKYIMYPYSKAICQAVLTPVPKSAVEEIPYEELVLIKSERGMGMIGSTDEKK